MELIEIAKGVSLEDDILAQMEFTPLISNKLKEFDSAIFNVGLMGLKNKLKDL